MMRKFFLILFLLAGCVNRQQALLTGQTLEGTPVCLDSRDNIPAVVKKFFNTRDLTTEEGKIDYLIERIRNSKLVFIRNRVEYDSPAAAGFLRWKLNRWRKKDEHVASAQDFVHRIASGSKMSGHVYTVILQDGTRHNLQVVLQNELDALEYCLKQETIAETPLTSATEMATAVTAEKPIPVPTQASSDTNPSDTVPAN